MSISALVAMLFILGTVGGGFVFFLRLAIKKERKKGKD